MSLLLALFLAPPSHAADGFWHPNNLMGESAAFGRLNEGALGPFEERQRKVDEAARALNNYALALDLLGDKAGSEDRVRLDELRKQFNRQKAVLEAFAQALIDDVDATFVVAVERALEPIGGEIEMCEREVATGPQVPGMRPRMSANPDCTGTDLNEKLANALDRDPLLKADVDEIVALAWPDISLPAEARPPVGGGAQWIAVRPLFAKGAGEALAAINRADENARLPFQAAIEEGADQAALERLAQEADKVDAKTAAAHAALAGPVLAAANKSLGKWGESVGWCANPVALGGCEGEDATDALVKKLLEDSRVEKSLKKASAAAGG